MTSNSGSCEHCNGRCCTTYVVPVTGADVWRIVQDQRLAPALFIQREPEEYATPHGFMLRLNGPTYGLALQHSQPRKNERVCVFLLHLRDHVQRCGIYASRPLACQTYPMQARAEHATPRSDRLCPPDAWAGLERQQPWWRERLHAQEAAWDTYAPVVAAWNAMVRVLPPDRGFVLEEYLRYVVQAYDMIEQPTGEPNFAVLAQAASEL